VHWTPISCAIRSTTSRRRRCAFLVAAVDAGHDPGRLVADAEEPALALRDDLEAHRRLVEAGTHPLELPQRSPLRLADGLARHLDRDLAHRLEPFFRFTLRT
jgi:hypothetical protein